MPHGNDCQCQLCLFDHIEKLETERDRYREALEEAITSISLMMPSYDPHTDAQLSRWRELLRK